MAWCNSYSGIVLRSPRSTLIVDPVSMKLEECIQADVIVITHEHSDHFEPELVRELQRRTGALVVTTSFVARILEIEGIRILRPGESFVIKDCNLYAERCDHPANLPISLVVAIEDGPTIYHPSDSDPFGEMAEVRRRFMPRLLLYFGTSLENATTIAKIIKPDTVISYYTDKYTQKKLSELMNREVPEIKTRFVKQYEICHYPS